MYYQSSTMKNVFIFMCFAFLFHLVNSDVGGQHTPQEAIVVSNISYQGKPNNELKCKRPIEVPELFKNCHAEGKDHQFPSTKAVCDCTHCYKKMKIICNKNGKWYPETAKLCEKGSRNGCGICNAESIPKLLRCPKDKLGGYSKEIRYCLCKHTCSDIKIQCMNHSKKPYWKFMSGTDTCTAKTTNFTSHVKNFHITKIFNNGTYTYQCDSGYELHGSENGVCENGVLKPEIPKCFKQTTTSPLPTTPTTPVPTTLLLNIITSTPSTVTKTSEPTTLMEISTTLQTTKIITETSTTSTSPPTTTTTSTSTTTPKPTTLPSSTTQSTTVQISTTLQPTTMIPTTTTENLTTTLPPTTQNIQTTTLLQTTKDDIITTDSTVAATTSDLPVITKHATTEREEISSSFYPKIEDIPQETTQKSQSPLEISSTTETISSTSESIVTRSPPTVLPHVPSTQSQIEEKGTTERNIPAIYDDYNIDVDSPIFPISNESDDDEEEDDIDNELPILNSLVFNNDNFIYIIITGAVLICILLLFILVCIWCKFFKKRETDYFITDTNNTNNHDLKHINTEEFLKDYTSKGKSSDSYEESRLFLAPKKDISYDNDSVNIDLNDKKNEKDTDDKYYSKGVKV